ncbi:MAG: respiratory chain protein [Pyrobaculum sp.]
MRLPVAVRSAFISVLLVSFTGGLTAGLGHGFDLGTAWPGEPLVVLLTLIQGSLEPVHRLLTIAAGVLYVVVFALALRTGARPLVYLAATALAFLIATALTGRVVLLVLGGEVPAPWSYAVYPLNNALALAAAMSMALLASMFTPPVSTRGGYLFRGAAFWGAVASISGAYILGYHKITRTPLQYGLIPTFDDLPWLIHLLSATVAVALAAAGLAINKRGVWHWLLLASLLAQPATGLLMYLGASTDPWAPGPQAGLHAAFAHLFVISAFVIYVRGRQWTSRT